MSSPPSASQDVESGANAKEKGANVEDKVKQLVTVLDWDSLNALVGFFSLVVMVSATQVTPITTGIPGYQISVGAVGFAFALIAGIMRLGNWLESDFSIWVLSGFQFLWWRTLLVLFVMTDTNTIVRSGRGHCADVLWVIPNHRIRKRILRGLV
jgi:hypothetical protein